MPVARMAVKFNDGAAGIWAVTGKSHPTFTVTLEGAAVPANAWGQVRRIAFGVDRPYGGINSSGGPQHSGRPEHRLISLERESDMISPLLFKRCCNGMQLQRLVIYDPDYNAEATPNGRGLLIYAEDSHVVSFEGILEKTPGSRHTAAAFGAGDGDQFQAVTQAATQAVGATHRFDRMTILYTRLSVQVLGSTFQGWDTGSEIKFDSGPTAS
ncbi:MAG: type VI secretion system tube protein Hcp [Planctomycetales bacterium]|nr:type VI secretion system tube protein Hcp [Planctomycetales bacterium]